MNAVIGSGAIVTAASELSELIIAKLQMTLNFSKPNADSASLSAILGLDAGFNPANKVVTLNIGGAQVPFTLDAKGKGRGVSRYGSCALAYNKKTKKWALTAQLAKGTWHTPWAAHGLENKTVTKPGVWVTMPVVVAIGDAAFADERPVLYTATKDKSGSAK